MKRKRFYLIILLILICLTYICFECKTNYLKPEDILGVYINNELSDKMPLKGEALFQKAVCDDTSTKVTWDNDKWGLLISNLNQKIKCNLYFYSGETVFDFDYTGGEQTFAVPFSGTYKLETWGAQGGNSSIEKYHGGYGGYSYGTVYLKNGNDIFINVGGQGNSACLKLICLGGYNGGGNSGAYMLNEYNWDAGGGGATHIALINGTLKNMQNNINNIIMVSGGGGGATNRTSDGIIGGSGGGIIGGKSVDNDTSCSYIGNGGSQINGGVAYDCRGIYTNAINGSFGQGGTYLSDAENYNSSGGGGGYYGGSFVGGGGSGYIGNSLLTNKAMYCYNCEESSEESTKTISTTCSEETPTVNCAKKGNGYARITLISIDE